MVNSHCFRYVHTLGGQDSTTALVQQVVDAFLGSHSWPFSTQGVGAA